MEPIRIELPTGWPMGSVNAYLFTRPEVVLVDAGLKTDACRDALVEGLAAHGVALGDISRVVVTHPHVDHCGLAGQIVAASDATVWICELGAPWLTNTAAMWAERLTYFNERFLPRLGLSPEATMMTAQAMTALSTQMDPVPTGHVVTFRPDGVLQLGGRPWQVIHTPGHAAAQTVFHQPETGSLLSADMLLAVAPAPVIEQPPSGAARHEPTLPLFLRSLDRMEALAVGTVYPGHGRPFGDHRAIIARQRARIQARTAECLALVRGGMAAIPDLLDTMYAHQPLALRLAGLWMLLGYLDVLMADGLVREDEAGGVFRYYPA